MSFLLLVFVLIISGCLDYKDYHLIRGDKKERQTKYEFLGGQLTIVVSAQYMLGGAYSLIQYEIENQSDSSCVIIPRIFAVRSKFYDYTFDDDYHYSLDDTIRVVPHSNYNFKINWGDQNQSGSIDPSEVFTAERHGIFLAGEPLITDELTFVP